MERKRTTQKTEIITMSTQVTPFEAASKPETLQDLLKKDAYRNRFDQVLGERAPQFISSILSLGSTMKDVEPRSVIAAAAIAASLNLPIDKNLGFAWIIPYSKNGRKLASFQMGYHGLINLAQRTAAYERLNAEAINAEAYKGRDNVGEPIIDWDLVDPEKPVAGYVFAFKMINGFVKIAYWSKKKVEAHAKQYSQSYRGGYDSPWKTHPDQMALKTVIANELRRWGMLSVEMQGAFARDHSMQRDIDAPAEFPEAADEIARPVIDGQAQVVDKSSNNTASESEAGFAPVQPAPKQPKAKPAPKVEPAPTPEPPDPNPVPYPELEPEPAQTQQAAEMFSDPETQAEEGHQVSTDTPYDIAVALMAKDKITEAEVMALLKRKKFTAETTEELMQVADRVLIDMAKNWAMVSAQVRIDRKKAK